MHQRVLAACSAWALLTAAPVSAEDESSSQWVAVTQFGAGYDTNANGSTSEQAFLGFTLDPHSVATKSPFGELAFSLENTATLAPQRGFVSTLQLTHRANPDAPFVDQSVASLGTEAVVIVGETRYSAGVSGYASWLRGQDQDDERGLNVDLAVSHQAEELETALTLRAGRLSNAPAAYEILDVDRYLGGVSLTRHNIGSRSASIGVTMLAGRDIARRVDSPFGNNRIGAQLSANWAVRGKTTFYMELSNVHSDYPTSFFDVDRQDQQYGAAFAFEFTDWPAAKWTFTPQLHWVRNDSNVTLFSYDRIEAAVYVRRAR